MATVKLADETQEMVDTYTVRLVVRIGGMYGTAGSPTIVRAKIKELIAKHPELRAWKHWGRNQLENQAVREYFDNYCGFSSKPVVLCGCGAGSTHRHHGHPCCGGSMCCCKANV